MGKIRLTLTPWLNHGWHAPLYVTARGLGTSPIPVGTEILEIEFDFIGHRLIVQTSRGAEQFLPLQPQSVADFYRATLDLLAGMGVPVAIRETPNGSRTRSAFFRTEGALPMTRPPPIASGARSCRPIASSSSSAPASSARRVRSISSGAVSISPRPGSPDAARRSILAACLVSPTRSRAKPIRTKSAAPGSGRGTRPFRARPSTPTPIPSRRVFATSRLRRALLSMRRWANYFAV